MPAKKTTRRKAADKKSRNVGSTIRSTASDVVAEVEKTGNVILREIGDSFDLVSGKVSETARAVAMQTKKVTEKVAGTETTQYIQDLLKDVEEAGESLLGVIGKRIDSLRKTLTTKVSQQPAAAGRKAPAKKKAAVKKKAAAKKKAPAKKAAIKKKPPVKKKAAIKKKPPVKKKAAVKKKAPARKKAPAKRKAPVKKKVASAV